MMKEWIISMGVSGKEVMRVKREVPDDLLPPAYVDENNNRYFLPLPGKWERTQINSMRKIAYYYKIGE
jgi:hypothetical protein